MQVLLQTIYFNVQTYLIKNNVKVYRPTADFSKLAVNFSTKGDNIDVSASADSEELSYASAESDPSHLPRIRDGFVQIAVGGVHFEPLEVH